MKILAYLTTFHAFSIMENRICYQCDHYLKDHQCKLFGKINVVTGKIYYESCYEVRSNHTKCGENGVYYSRYQPFQELLGE